MRLRSDLLRLIRRQFDNHGIAYSPSASAARLVARYLEMMFRRIQPGPRRVHLSDETHASLGRLAHGSGDDPAAWGAVFRLRQLLVEGRNANGFLSRNIRYATGARSRDGLLWHYGMHHFHLASGRAATGFARQGSCSAFIPLAPLTARDVSSTSKPPRF